MAGFELVAAAPVADVPAGAANDSDDRVIIVRLEPAFDDQVDVPRRDARIGERIEPKARQSGGAPDAFERVCIGRIEQVRIGCRQPRFGDR